MRAVSAVTLLRKATGVRQEIGVYGKTAVMPTVLTQEGLQSHHAFASQERCQRPQMLDLQHAFQTVAHGMVALGALDSIGAHNLKHLLDLDDDDPNLKGALRETLAKLEMSCFAGQRLEYQAGPETGNYAIKVGDGVTESLRTSLTLLEIGLSDHLLEERKLSLENLCYRG